MSTNPNKESKSVLSRLLASENVTVIHDGKARTASFDVRNRVLTLPVLGNMSDELYDMIVGHEVGHALFTPFTEEDEKSIKDGKPLHAAVLIGGDAANIAMGYLNVVEDARIERMMKDKFPGLRRDFYIGYKQLDEMNFFETRGVDVNEKSFIDRINLHYKVGTYRHNYIDFSDEEMPFIKMIDEAKTFDDVVEVTKKIWEYCKNKKRDDYNSKTDVEFTIGDDGHNSSGLDRQSDATNGKDGSKRDHDGDNYGNTGILPDECLTYTKFQNHLKRLTDNNDNISYHYHSIPSLKKNVILDFKKIMSFYNRCRNAYEDTYKQAERDSSDFANKSKKAVNILVKQFLMKKAASDDVRASIQKTGMLDTVRMMNYNFTDDIFRRQKVVKKGKSHGLVFFMDWSGSMAVCFEDTLKQLFQIVFFCRRLNIPFEVYAFSSRISNLTTFDLWEYPPLSIGSKYGFHDFNLMNILSSRMNGVEFNTMMTNLFVQMNAYNRSKNVSHYSVPSEMELSSTPLNESVVAAMKIVPEFKMNNKLDIVHTVFLTDGETSGSGIYSSHNYLKSNIIVDKKTYLVKEHTNCTDALYTAFRDITGCRSIGFFIDSRKRGGMSTHTKCRYFKSIDKKTEEMYDKEGFVVADRSLHGHDELFIVQGNSDIDDDDLDEVLSGKKSNTGIRNAFIKTMDNRVASRIMLNRFIDLIAVE